jgi:hypothetical protein
VSAGQDEEADASVWQALLNSAMNSAIVDADCPNPERHLLRESVEDRGRGGCGRSSAEFEDIPATDDIAGGELLPDPVR